MGAEFCFIQGFKKINNILINFYLQTEKLLIQKIQNTLKNKHFPNLKQEKLKERGREIIN
jgi:hypothetical protein